MATIPEAGLLAVCADDQEALAIARGAACRVVPYGLSEGSALRGELREIGPVETRFEAARDGASLGEFAIPLPGAHNVRNALGVLAVCLDLGLGADEIRAGLARFGGVARRQEVRGEAGGVLIIDDFAHHPTAIRETIAAIGARYAGRRLWALFEPRSNTSRRNVHQKEYVDALEGADVAIVAGVENAGKIPEAERLRPDRIAADLRERGREARFIETVEGIVADASGNAPGGRRAARHVERRLRRYRPEAGQDLREAWENMMDDARVSPSDCDGWNLRRGQPAESPASAAFLINLSGCGSAHSR